MGQEGKGHQGKKEFETDLKRQWLSYWPESAHLAGLMPEYKEGYRVTQRLAEIRES